MPKAVSKRKAVPICPECGARKCRVVVWTGKRNGRARTERLVRETCGRRKCVQIRRAKSAVASIQGG